jgi:hypothetical protein
MKTYQVVLSRTYLVTIQAGNQEQAKVLSEFYIGDCPDLSNERDRMEKNFSIEKIEMVNNEAIQIINEVE